MTDVNLSICQKTKERAIIGYLKWGPSFLNLMPHLGDVSWIGGHCFPNKGVLVSRNENNYFILIHTYLSQFNWHCPFSASHCLFLCLRRRRKRQREALKRQREALKEAVAGGPVEAVPTWCPSLCWVTCGGEIEHVVKRHFWRSLKRRAERHIDKLKIQPFIWILNPFFFLFYFFWPSDFSRLLIFRISQEFY